MEQDKINVLTFTEQLDLFILFLESKSYTKLTLDNYRRTLKKIDPYMKKHGTIEYSEKVGIEYYENYTHEHKLEISRQAAIHTAIHRFNNYYLGKEYSLQQTINVELLPIHYEEIISHYVRYSYERGNKDITTKNKCRFVRLFLKGCILQGYSDISLLNPSCVIQACLYIQNKDGWAIIREFLKFIYAHGIQPTDYSTFVPHYKRPTHLPIVYSEDEICRLENTIDRETDIGNRDYALILLATRLGMRSGDIVKLTLDELDFDNNTISFNQQKTGEVQKLPMIPEIRDALNNYINNVRPKTDSRFIFLRQNAPLEQITTSVIRFETTKYFKKAGIDISSKKHGPHVFRSSLASSMINNDIPYETIRKILGHTNPDSIKHYARLDIEKLREFAIVVPEPSSYFKIFLEGGSTL